MEMRRTFDETVRGRGGGGRSDGAVVGGGSDGGGSDGAVVGGGSDGGSDGAVVGGGSDGAVVGGGSDGGTSGGASGDNGGGVLFVFTLSAFTACRQSWYASSVKTRRLRGGKASDATTWHV